MEVESENTHLASPISIITACDKLEQELNPLHSDNIPVANMVVIEIEGHSFLEPKKMRSYDRFIKVLDYILLSLSMVIIFGILSGIFVLAIWLFNPYIFGRSDDDT